MRPKILAVASKGGHWEQMMLLRPAFEGAMVTFACTDPQQGSAVGDHAFVRLSDYSRSEPLSVLRGLIQVYRIVTQVRPDLVLSTGAAPGLLALLWGRLLGAQTIWLDSIANSQQLSLSGSIARRFAHTTLTQWEHLREQGQVEYWGSVI